MNKTAKQIDERIKRLHDAHCNNWQSWQSQERDQNGKHFTATWAGCQHCGVKILKPEGAQ